MKDWIALFVVFILPLVMSCYIFLGGYLLERRERKERDQ